MAPRNPRSPRGFRTRPARALAPALLALALALLAGEVAGAGAGAGEGEGEGVLLGGRVPDGDGDPVPPAPAPAPAAVATAASTLECHVRKYSYKVVKADSAGRQCWDLVGVNACWGRCDSREISDWRFPNKRAYHPVCLHAAREATAVTLRHCDPEAEPGTERYEFMQALSCRCSVCKSSEASCESVRFKATRARGRGLR